MKGYSLTLLSFLALAASINGRAAEQLIPAGSLVQCTVSEPALSSKTTEVGDPVLCQVSHVELYSRSILPYGSYLVGRFEEYKDPGHFVGKGWMELKFDRIVIPHDQVIPVTAKVVQAPKYPVDKQGRIHGKGHPVRDAIEWSIPVLWPIDLLTLPRRGPRPVLKAETRLTLKIMDDFGVPLPQSVANMPYRYPTAPPTSSYGFAPRAPMSYIPPSTTAPSAVPPVTVLMLRDGNGRLASDYWFEGGTGVRYTGLNGTQVTIPMELFDLPTTIDVNRRRGVTFTVRSVAY